MLSNDLFLVLVVGKFHREAHHESFPDVQELAQMVFTGPPSIPRVFLPFPAPLFQAEIAVSPWPGEEITVDPNMTTEPATGLCTILSHRDFDTFSAS